MDTMTVTQGFTLKEVITIRDSNDNPITTYAGSEVLSATVRAGRSLPALVTVTPTWNIPAQGTINLLIPGGSGANTTGVLNPGQYLIQATLNDGTNLYDVYEGFLVVGFAVGTDVLPTTYNTYNDLLTYAPWITKLQTEFQVEGFVMERGLARAWLDQIIVNHAANMFLDPQIGQPGFMPLSLFPSTARQYVNLWLREQLNLNYLVRRQNVIEIVTKKSLYFIGRSQLDALNDKQMDLAMWFGSDADKIASSLIAEITLGVADPVNQDTWPSIVVHCGALSLRG